MYQYGQEREQIEREERRQRDMEEKGAASGTIHPDMSKFTATAPTQPVATLKPIEEVKPDELTAKLRACLNFYQNDS